MFSSEVQGKLAGGLAPDGVVGVLEWSVSTYGIMSTHGIHAAGAIGITHVQEIRFSSFGGYANGIVELPGS